MKYVFGHPTVYGLVPLFNVNYEQNIPTLFSVILLLISGALLGVICCLHRKQHSEVSVYWGILSLGFIYMSIDEFAVLHEKLSNHITPLIEDYAHGVLRFSWIIPAAILLLFLGLFFFKFLFSLPKTTRVNFITSGTIYLAGAIGMELPGAYYSALHGLENLTYSLITTLEESLEMLGLILFISALLDYLSTHFSEVSIKLQH